MSFASLLVIVSILAVYVRVAEILIMRNTTGKGVNVLDVVLQETVSTFGTGVSVYVVVLNGIVLTSFLQIALAARVLEFLKRMPLSDTYLAPSVLPIAANVVSH